MILFAKCDVNETMLANWLKALPAFYVYYSIPKEHEEDKSPDVPSISTSVSLSLSKFEIIS